MEDVAYILLNQHRSCDCCDGPVLTLRSNWDQSQGILIATVESFDLDIERPREDVREDFTAVAEAIDTDAILDDVTLWG